METGLQCRGQELLGFRFIMVELLDGLLFGCASLPRKS